MKKIFYIVIIILLILSCGVIILRIKQTKTTQNEMFLTVGCDDSKLLDLKLSLLSRQQSGLAYQFNLSDKELNNPCFSKELKIKYVSAKEMYDGVTKKAREGVSIDANSEEALSFQSKINIFSEAVNNLFGISKPSDEKIK